MAITAKQQRFVDEYLIDLNATQAAKRAGYSAKTAMQQGWQLLDKTLVAAAISEAQAVRSEKTGITQEYVLEVIRDTTERCRVDGEEFNATGVFKGAELLGRHLAMFTDKTENNHKLTINVLDKVGAFGHSK